jgi:type IV secretion system protein VirB1
MDFSAFMALAEGCAPRVDIRPLTEIVRAASGFEPLSLTIYGSKPIKILASSKDEAIALAMQAKIGAQDVRLGLAGLTFGDLAETGISVADAFESCPSLHAATQILDDDPKHFSKGKAAAALNAAGAKLPLDDESYHREERPPPPEESAALAEAQAPPKRHWDVFGAGSRNSLLVYQASPSPR